MIIKGTKQLGSFTRGINLYVPKKVVQQNGGGYSGPTALISTTFAFQMNGITPQNTSQVISDRVNDFLGIYLVNNLCNQSNFCDGSCPTPYSAPYLSPSNMFGVFYAGSELDLSYLNGTWTLHFKLTSDIAPPITFSTVNKTVTTNNPNNIPLDFGEGITLTAMTDPTYFIQFCG